METRDRLSRESLALATGAGDPVAIGEALAARYWACLGPDRLAERLALSRELLELAERTGELRFAVSGWEAALSANLVLGNTVEADRALAGYTRTAAELRQPGYLFLASVAQGSRALSTGRFDDAQRHYDDAYERGRRTVPFADVMHSAQIAWLRHQRGDVTDLFDTSASFLAELIANPSWRGMGRGVILYAHVVARDGARARAALDELAKHGFADLPRDEHWLLVTTLISDAVIDLQDRPRAQLLFDLLRPYAGLIAVNDLLRAGAGSVAAWWLSNALCAAGFLGIFALGKGDGVAIALLAMAIGGASSASRVLPMSIQADVIDWDELHTRERKEGTYFAAWNLAGKAAGGLAVTLVGFALAATGFVRGEAPAHEALLGMRLVVSVLPAAAFAASTVLLSGFVLGESEHGAIRAELDARACI